MKPRTFEKIILVMIFLLLGIIVIGGLIFG
jgi:hypothetical protein